MIQKHIHKLGKHKNYLYSAVAVLLVLQILSLTFIIIQVSNLNKEIEKTKLENTDALKKLEENLSSELDDFSRQNQEKLSEITVSLSAQQTSFEQQIKKLKLSGSDFSSVIEDSVKGVVSVGTDKAGGSGFIVEEDGYIVTNAHVVEGARRIDVLTYDASVKRATLIGYDITRDIALLKIEGNGYNALQLADSGNLQVGNKVVAIGNPLGLSFTVTEGIVSALDREGPNGLREYIQTDVSLNPGNSGGPLIDKSGKVIGINNFKVGDAEGLGFALESNSIKEVVNRIANLSLVS